MADQSVSGSGGRSIGASAAGEEVDLDDEKLLDGIGNPVMMVTVDGTVTAWNESMEAFTGVGREVVETVADVQRTLKGSGDEEMLAATVLEAPETKSPTSVAASSATATSTPRT